MLNCLCVCVLALDDYKKIIVSCLTTTNNINLNVNMSMKAFWKYVQFITARVDIGLINVVFHSLSMYEYM